MGVITLTTVTHVANTSKRRVVQCTLSDPINRGSAAPYIHIHNPTLHLVYQPRPYIRINRGTTPVHPCIYKGGRGYTFCMSYPLARLECNVYLC